MPRTSACTTSGESVGTEGGTAGDSTLRDAYVTVRKSHVPETQSATVLVAETRVGAYRIVRVLGQGGMGIVYEAEDTRLGRRVALKSVPPAFARDERLRARLRQEARAAAAVTHPNVATVYAFEEIEEQLYIASELVEGHTLRFEIERGRAPLALALRTARDTARGLAAAHAKGVVHRDLKPENVLRTTHGGVKILDFGIAQFDPNSPALLPRTRLTETGLVAGTPPYMAPEQLLGHAVDARADQYALGVLLYELACGRHPFGGRTLPSVIARALGEPPEEPAPQELPPPVWNVVERCLRKSPAERYPSTADLVSELETLSRHLPSVVEGKPPTPGATYPVNEVSHRALWWWQFHQLAAALLYWVMVWPAWHVHRWIGTYGLPFFLALLAAIAVAGNLRLHLWFSSRIYPGQLASQRPQVGTWVRAADLVFATLLLAAGLIIGQDHAEWAAFLTTFAIGSAVAFSLIEPATARAAFGPESGGGRTSDKESNE